MSNNEFYLGNPLLKKPRVAIDFSQEEIEEIIKCEEDINYFFKTYIKIVHVDKGLINFEPYPYQSEVVNLYKNNRFVITKAPRQSGKTTSSVAYILHYILHNEDKKVAILANKAKVARQLLARIKLAYMHLPRFLQQGITEWNKGSIVLENGCSIIADSTSGDSGRSESIALLYLDEFAFVPTNIAEEFFKSVYPTISSGEETQIFINSTPCGFNHFYKMWNDAVEKRSGFVACNVDWDDVPGRDEKFKKDTIAIIGEEAWLQEYEGEFLGSSNTLIGSHCLRTLSHVTPIVDNGDRQVYEFPKLHHNYNICVDVSRGLGGDYSAFSVMDVTEFPYRQVAKYRSNEVSPLFLPHIIYEVATQYNQASVLVEINDIGQQVVDILQYDIEYDNIITTVAAGRKGQIVSGGFTKGVMFGVRTTTPVKRIGCASFKSLMEDGKMMIRDFDTIREMKNFIRVRDSFEADANENDDLVMGLVLFAWLANQRYFKEVVGIDIREKMYDEHIRQIEHELMPIITSHRSFMESNEIREQDDEFDKWF